MVSKYDYFYTLSLDNGHAVIELAKKLKKGVNYYATLYRHITELVQEGLIVEKDKKYYIKDSPKAKHLLQILDYCVSNKIDYNILLLPTTVEFLKAGLQRNISELNLHNKTKKKIVVFLSRHGFLIILASKPFKAELVYSLFLELVVKYFDPNFKFTKTNISSDLNEELINKNLNGEFSKYKTSVKENLETEINLVHQSLSLEGNSLTLQETEKLILKNIPPAGKPFKDMLDTVNYKKALDFLLIDKTQLNLEKVLEFHKIAMQALSRGNGELRKVNVYIQGNLNFKTSDWKDLPFKLNDLFSGYALNVSKKMKSHEAVEFAADLHSEFQRIHPFVDGNSRTSRALFVHTLCLKGFPIIEFLPGFVNQYMSLTKLSKERDDAGFRKLMKIIVLESLRKTNRKIKFS